MPINDQDKWNKIVKLNDDPYSKACVDAAREVMRLLDERPGSFDPHAMICEAGKNIDAGGITGFMAGAAAVIVSQNHSRGEEFRRAWNASVSPRQAEEANAREGFVLNPAIMAIEVPE